MLAEGRAGDVVDEPDAGGVTGATPAGEVPAAVPPSALDGSPAGGATGAEEASTRVSEAMRSRSDRIVFRWTSAAPPSGTSSSLVCSARRETLVASPAVDGRAASAVPGSALRDSASSPLLDPAGGTAADRGAAGVESGRPGAPGVPEVEASGTRCTEPAPLLAPALGALGEFGGLPAPPPEREAWVEPAPSDGDTAVFGIAEAGPDGGVPGLDGAGAPGVAGAGAGVDEPVAGEKLGRTGRPGVEPRGSITSGGPLDGEVARRALSASTIEAMPCRTSLFAPSDDAPADEGVPGVAGDTLRLTVPSAATAAGGAASTREAG